jgi:hypothetical protein
MEMILGCGHLGEDEFVTAFEQCRLVVADFHHADPLRLAWIYAGRYDAADGEARLLTGIRQLAVKAGVAEKFQHTTTVAWARLVAASRRAWGRQQTFDEWIHGHPEFLDRRLLQRYYTSATVRGEPARTSGVDPDLAPLV